MPNNLDELYMMYMKDVYRYLLFLCQDHYTAEDLVQDTFTRAYIFLDQYDRQNVKPWLLRAAHNAFIDYNRKQKRSTPKEAAFFQHRLFHEHTPEQVMLQRERLEELRKWC